MGDIPKLKELVCLLSCRPRNMADQLPAALDCLRAAVSVQAAGICWPDPAGRVQMSVQDPPDFKLTRPIRQAVSDFSNLSCPLGGQNGESWLAVPMKVGGTAVGRLWVVDIPARMFSQDDREFIMMMGNQLALAMENTRLYEETQRLAGRRGELLRRVIATQDERCRRISRDLHDEISQSLAALALDMEALQVAGLKPQHETLKRLVDFHPRVVTTLKEVNRIILDLRPTLLEDMGLLPAMQWFAQKRLEEAGIQVYVRDNALPTRLPPHIETTLYRIAQEAITNIAKHACAQHVWLQMSRHDEQVNLTVRDDGRGFEVSSVIANSDNRIGLGLFGMNERASLVGGTCTVESYPGEGTRISVSIPLVWETTNDADTSIAG